jgi:hypothetical protein
MKLSGIAKSAFIACLTATPCFADSITTIDHLTVNGILTAMSEGKITLEAHYASGTKTLTIPLNNVETIEFNSVAFNPGPPPKALGLGPGTATATHLASPPQPAASDTLEIRGSNGQRQPCRLISIDADRVYCETPTVGKKKDKPNEFPRRIVLRVLVGRVR